MNNYRTGPWLVALAAFLWAFDAPFRSHLTQELSSTTIVFLEHVLIGIIVLFGLWAYVKELKKLTWRGWLAVAFIGFGGSALATVMFTQSFHYVNPSVAILLQKVQPLVAILLAVAVLRERLSRTFWLWALAAVAGAYLLSFPELAPGSLSLNGGAMGVLLALGAAALWGGSTVFGRYLLKDLSFQAMTALRFLSALVFLFILEAYYGRLAEASLASGRDWLYVFIIAIVAGFISLLIYYRGLTYTSASVATLAELVFPLAAVVINWIFLDAALSAVQLVGGALLLFAITRLSLVNTALERTPAASS
ncbi:MAG: DMT family transporter [Candidatus Veblenbacteria bacterium]|nr:DMT family transporter [Candidatus Veblenbacteria bacterium]MDZ4230024.1 DMT family transporter [Candidatus Veblenbacteria bacterium]